MREDFSFVPVTEDLPDGADFAIVMEDDSMAPFFPEGSVIYFTRRETPEELQPGLFYHRGALLVRQWCEDSNGTLHLLCANPRRETMNLRLSGKEKASCLCLGAALCRKPLPMPLYP